jgi:3-hydroxyisobutyrate dehydrogenase
LFFKASIAFLGLGNMGKHMARHLLSANHHVKIFDTDPKAYDHFKERSKLKITIATNPENAINQSDFVILMLPNSQIVRDVCQSNIFP